MIIAFGKAFTFGCGKWLGLFVEATPEAEEAFTRWQVAAFGRASYVRELHGPVRPNGES